MDDLRATAAERFAGFAVSLALEEIPTDVLDAAKLHFLDVLGCGLAAHALGVATEGRTTMSELGGQPQAAVIGGQALPAANAAFANAMLCHGLDFDDTHPDSVAHVSVVIVPAALAAAEAAGAAGGELAAAVVAGNEVVTRVGMAAPHAFHRRGFHPTAICGIFGGTAAASRLAGADAATTASALGIAGSFAGGVFAYLEDGTATKPMHPAWAAHGSLLATRLAGLGAEGPPSILEGRFGLYDAFVGERVELESQLADLGERWETPRISYKAYPACHFMHGSLGASAGLLDRFDAADVEEVIVRVPPAFVALVLEPEATKVAPRSEYEAKFSLQYSTAAMLVNGRVDVSTYAEPALRDERVLELAGRVRYETDEYETYPAAFPGGVRVRLRDGRTVAAELPYQPGCVENPLSSEEVREKFRANASLALADDAVLELEERALTLEEQPDLRALGALLARVA